MIDVLDLLAEGEIEYGTKLIVIDEKDERNEFIYDDYNNGMFIDDDGVNINVYHGCIFSGGYCIGGVFHQVSLFDCLYCSCDVCRRNIQINV